MNKIYLRLGYSNLGYQMYIFAIVFCVALAQENSSQRENEDDQAKAFYKTATVFFDEADYEQAIHFFKMAYDRSNRTPILYNIAVAYEKLGDHELAIQYYEEYKFSAPEEEIVVLERKIENLKKLVQKKQVEQQELVEQVVEQTETEQPMENSTKTSTQNKYVPIAATTVFALTASYFTIRSTAQRGNIERYCSDANFCTDSAQEFLDIETKNALLADISWGLTVGGVLYTVISSKKHKKSN